MAIPVQRPINPTMAQLALAKFGLQALQSGNQDSAYPALSGSSQAPQQGQAAPQPKRPSSTEFATSMINPSIQVWSNWQKQQAANQAKPGVMQGSGSAPPDTSGGFSTTPMPEMGPTVQAAAVQQTGPTTQPGYFDSAGNYVQGVAGAMQAKQGYDQWQQGNKLGGGLNMAAGGANVGAAAGSSGAAAAGPYLSGALGAYNAYNALQGEGSNEQKANEANKALGMAAADFYTFGGASLGKKAFGKEFGAVEEKVDKTTENPWYQAVFNPYLYAATVAMDKLLPGGKDQDQKRRDAVRKMMQEGGFLDDKFNVQLAGGNKFDLGQDGSKQIYNTDPNNAATGETIADVHLLAAMIGGQNQKIKSDVAGMLTNAALSNGDPVSNVMQMYQNFGITNGDEARGLIGQLQEKGVITKEDGDQMQQNIAKLFGMPSNRPVAGPPKKSSGSSKPEPKKKSGGSSKQKAPLFPAKPQVDIKPGSTAQFSMADYINSINRIRAGQ